MKADREEALRLLQRGPPHAQNRHNEVSVWIA